MGNLFDKNIFDENIFDPGVAATGMFDCAIFDSEIFDCTAVAGSGTLVFSGGAVCGGAMDMAAGLSEVLEGGAVCGGAMEMGAQAPVEQEPEIFAEWEPVKWPRTAAMEFSGGAVCGGELRMRAVHDTSMDDLVLSMMMAAWEEEELDAVTGR